MGYHMVKVNKKKSHNLLLYIGDTSKLTWIQQLLIEYIGVEVKEHIHELYSMDSWKHLLDMIVLEHIGRINFDQTNE